MRLGRVVFVFMKLTFDNLHSAGRGGVGFNWHQLRVLGVGWPPPRGWLQNLIGTEIDDRKWEVVMALKGVPKKVRNQILSKYGVSRREFACSKLEESSQLILRAQNQRP